VIDAIDALLFSGLPFPVNQFKEGSRDFLRDSLVLDHAMSIQVNAEIPEGGGVVSHLHVIENVKGPTR
jgi:hypothetical protein